MSAPLRVLALAHDPSGPSARYRVAQFGPLLRAEGIRCTLAAIPRGSRERRRWFAALAPHDVVVWSRTLLGAAEAKWLRRAATRLVYDVDDALPFRTPAQGGGRSSRRSARFRRLCAAADLVVAGNAWIAELAAPHARAVQVIPTAVDTGRYAAPATGRDSERTLVWIGQPATAPYLATLAAPLAAVAGAMEGLTLRVIGAPTEALEALHTIAGLTVQVVEWSSATEARELAGADIGLAPLCDDPWSRGKCGLRLLQYAAARLPAVATPVGTQAALVEAGAAIGATTAGGWERALRELLGSAARRRELGDLAGKVCQASYSVAAVAPRLIAAWRSAAGISTPDPGKPT